MTTFDLIDYYLFNLIPPLKSVKTSSSIGHTMVEEMNEVRDIYLSGGPIKEVLKRCVCDRHGHQYCIVEDAVKDAADALMGSVHVSVFGEKPLVKDSKLVNSFEDFEELYDFVSSVIGGISGIGPLTVYDTAKRIGHLFDEPIYPKMYVYLNAGALDGAKALLGRNDLKFREPITLFEPYFGTFPSIFIEDILCIFKNEFCPNSINIKSTAPSLKKAAECVFSSKTTLARI